MGWHGRALVVGLGAALALSAAGSSLAAEGATDVITVPATVQPWPWNPVQLLRGPVVKGHTFEVSVGGGYCVPEEPPRIDHITVLERPKTRNRPFMSAVLTVYVERPEHTQGIKPPKADVPVYGTASVVVTGLCSGIGWGATPRAKLKRPPKSLFLYDGSYSPPRRAWPNKGETLKTAWARVERQECMRRVRRCG